LAALHRAHVAAIAFENLDTALPPRTKPDQVTLLIARHL
jgi:arylamine N-acetyltransferase